MNNPLFSQTSLPLFQQIQPEHALPAIQKIIEESQARIDALVQEKTSPTWENLMLPLEDISASIHNIWSPISHLNSVMNTASWRDAYNACLFPLTEFSTALGQNKALYQRILALSKTEHFLTLNSVQQKIIHDQCRDFELSGVALEGQDKKRYAEIQYRLSELQTKFEENVLDATRAWFYVTENKEELLGLPEHIVFFAEQKAKEKNLKGYVLTLDAPIYISIMKYAENALLREKMYFAYTTRASDTGPNAGEFDNTEIILELLKLKQELSHLLGFKHYADYSLERKMANSAEEVNLFLRDLVTKAKPFAEKEKQELERFSDERLNLKTLNSWDIAWASERLQQEKYAINEELLRSYFPIDKVLSGMFEIIHHLYGMQVKEIPSSYKNPDFSINQVETWHMDVRFFEIYDEKGSLRGQFYLDLFARENKRGGAWMDDCRSRRVMNGHIVTPVAYLTCNFAPPQLNKTALLTHDDVITLFHEFGHGLHHMLTQVDYAHLSGISGVEWDAVELPSQFMENFCWQKECIPLFSEQVETKEPLPASLFESMLAAKNFQSAMQILRQVEFSLFDILLYSQAVPANGQALQKILDDLRKEVALIIPPDFYRFQHSFSHIFAGGYAAGYYSYKWAEVLSSDAFSKFEEEGILNKTIGLAFLEAILEKGGSQPAMELFIQFRGREPKVDALLKSNGLLSA